MHRTKLSALFAFYLMSIAVHCGLSQPVTNWGPAVGGVQLCICATNTVATSSSALFLRYQIKSSSTNEVGLGDTGQPMHDFDFSLVDASGAVHPLKSKGVFSSDLVRNTWVYVAPGEVYEKDIEVQIDDSIKPGNYSL